MITDQPATGSNPPPPTAPALATGDNGANAVDWETISAPTANYPSSESSAGRRGLTAANLEALGAQHAAWPQNVGDVATLPPWVPPGVDFQTTATPLFLPQPPQMATEGLGGGMPSAPPGPNYTYGPSPANDLPPTPWPERIAITNRIWETAVPQPTARMHNDEVSQPARVLPELDNFRRLGEYREQVVRNRASGSTHTAPTISSLMRDGAPEPQMPAATPEQVQALPNYFMPVAAGMSQHQRDNRERHNRLRTERRQAAATRLASMMAERDPEDFVMGTSRVGSVTPASSSQGGPVCVICQETVEHGEEMCILQCAHMYHAQCMDMVIAQSVANHQTATCPLCRGGVTGGMRHRLVLHQPETYSLGTPEEDTPAHDSPRTPRSSFQSLASASLPQTPSQTLPWWPAEGSHPTESVFHGTTQMPGKCSVIVDSGAWTNLIGETLARKRRDSREEAGQEGPRSRTVPEAEQDGTATEDPGSRKRLSAV